MMPAGHLFRLWLMTTEYAHTGGYVLTPARMGTLAVGAWLASAIREPGLKKRVDDLAPLFLAGTSLILLAINLPDLKMEGHEPVGLGTRAEARRRRRERVGSYRCRSASSRRKS